MRTRTRRHLPALIASIPLLLAAPPALAAPDAAHMYGTDGHGRELDLVYGVHNYISVRGTIDDSATGAFGLAVEMRPLNNDAGTAACPASPPAATGAFDNNLAVGAAFDQSFTAGVWNLGHRVLACVFYVHHDNSITGTSEAVTFRDPVDTLTLTPTSLPAGSPGVSQTLKIGIAGESDHQYAGLIRVHAASQPCAATYDADTGVAGDIPNPGSLRFWDRHYAGSAFQGVALNVGAMAVGQYRVCAWLGPRTAPVTTATATFTVGDPFARSFTLTSPAAPRRIRPAGAIRLGSATCAGACTVTVAGVGVRLVRASTLTLPSGGSVGVSARLTAAGRAALSRRGRLRLRVRVTVTPTGGGSAQVRTTTVDLRLR